MATWVLAPTTPLNCETRGMYCLSLASFPSSEKWGTLLNELISVLGVLLAWPLSEGRGLRQAEDGAKSTAEGLRVQVGPLLTCSGWQPWGLTAAHADHEQREKEKKAAIAGTCGRRRGGRQGATVDVALQDDVDPGPLITHPGQAMETDRAAGTPQTQNPRQLCLQASPDHSTRFSQEALGETAGCPSPNSIHHPPPFPPTSIHHPPPFPPTSIPPTFAAQVPWEEPPGTDVPS